MKNQDALLEKLRSLLEGQKILQVLPPEASEAICKFVLENGVAFRLHANDLGFWIEETVSSQDQIYHNLDTLINDCYQYYPQGICPITIENGIMIVSASDGTKFRGDISSFSDWEQLILNDQEGLFILQEYILLGDIWKLGFQKDRCSDHLVYRPTESE